MKHGAAASSGCKTLQVSFNISPASSFDVALAAQSLLYSKSDKSGKHKYSLPSDMSYLNTPVFHFSLENPRCRGRILMQYFVRYLSSHLRPAKLAKSLRVSGLRKPRRQQANRKGLSEPG